MLVGRIRDSNFCYKAPPGMENCQDLYVRVFEDEDVRIMSSAWMPTPEELARMNAGQPIHLHIYGQSHPVVSMTVPEN